ncbi:MAG: hypothetical protein ABIE36_02720 [Candidatus Diapherotrites archaeon]
MKKKGTILIENVVFIILNLIFLSVLVLFLLRQGSGAIVLEQIYAKEIAMIGDSAKPVMMIKIDMSKGKKLVDGNGVDFSKIVKINENIVEVKLTSKGGYRYAFFNNIDLTAYAERDDKNEYTGMYVLTINEKEKENE